VSPSKREPGLDPCSVERTASSYSDHGQKRINVFGRAVVFPFRVEAPLFFGGRDEDTLRNGPREWTI